MMNPVGNSQRKTSNVSVGKSKTNHRKLSKQPSDPLAATGCKRIAVKDVYSSNQNLSKLHHNCFDSDLNSSSSSSLRRLSQAGIAPASDEFKSVLKDLNPQPEAEIKQKSTKTQSSKTKVRKISFNEFGRASRFAKRLEDLSLSPRPKRSIDSLTTHTFGAQNRPSPDNRKLENNGSIGQSRKGLALHGIKEAWNLPERPVAISKQERRRHVSLPAPPSGFSLDKLVYQDTSTVVEPFQTFEKGSRKKSVTNSRPGRKISTVVSPNYTTMSQQPKEPDAHQPSKSSNNSSSLEHNDFTLPHLNEVKTKHFSTAKGTHDLHPNLLLGIQTKQTGPNNDKELPTQLEKQLSTEDTAGEHCVALKAHKNFRRIGKAALAAKRFLKIQNEEYTQEVHKRSISPLAKEDKDFDDMVEAMKTSYQELCLAEKNNTDANLSND